MFNIDERLKGLPATKDQVVTLYESLNQPHLAVPGRKAGPSKGYILGLRGPQGFAVFIYLYMVESLECAVYAPNNRNVDAEHLEAEVADAEAFLESMGFMMDNLHFRNRPPEEQENFVKTLPVFQRDPAMGKPKVKTAADRATTLGKLFASFCLAAVVFSGCKHVPSDKEREAAQIHYDLGVGQQVNEPQAALREFDRALALDPEMPEALHARGVLLHMAFNRPDEAIASYQKALEFKPTFTEAKTNLANVFLGQKRYDEAIKLYEEALNDMLYPTPYIAHGNLGWALYKKGKVEEGVGHLKSSVTTNPKFCLGYRNLGTIYTDQGQTEAACTQFGKYREHCPDSPDAYLREGVCLSSLGKPAEAKAAFDGCISKGIEPAKEDCQRLKDQLK